MNRLIMFSILTGCAGLPQQAPGASPVGDDGPALNGPIAPGKGAFILAHGFGGTADDWDDGIQPAIEAEGHAVLRTSVPATGSVESRAEALAPQIDAFLADTTATQVH